MSFHNNSISAESFTTKGNVIKGMRRHGRQRFGIVEYFYCHYFVRLEEGEWLESFFKFHKQSYVDKLLLFNKITFLGKPPKHYYANHPKQPHEMLEDWLQSMRKRKIHNSI